LSHHSDLWSIFIEALELRADSRVDELRRHVTPQWDSLGHMSLIAAIEEKFAVELSKDDINGIDTFDAAVTTLSRLGMPLSG
jgi:acyl carrier protein